MAYSKLFLSVRKSYFDYLFISPVTYPFVQLYYCKNREIKSGSK